jgi:hypothetical protein
MPVKIFFCYAHEDEPLLNKLKTALSPLQRIDLTDVWHDRDISGGMRWKEEINKHLNAAQIILLLISPDFIASDYCYSTEMKRALERDQRGEARVIPIILRPTLWQGAPFGKLQVFPRDGTPVTDAIWGSIDNAFHNVAEGIKTVVEEIIQRQNRAFPAYSELLNLATPPPSPPKPKVSRAVKAILIATVVLIMSTLIGGVFLWENKLYSSTPLTPTATTNSTRTPLPTSSPQPTFLYQADFLKGNQGWFKYAQSSQWSYNSNDKALESDGKLYCCDSTSISNIIIVAPYTMMSSDYTIEARIRVTGINTSHPYTESDPGQQPFFGLYVRGDASDQEGYKAGINGLPTGEPNAGAYSSFLAFGPMIPKGKGFYGKERGGKDFVLDKNWHDYRLDVKGNTFMLSIDNKPYYSAPMQATFFPSGPHIGIANYDFYLQVQNFTVSPPRNI